MQEGHKGHGFVAGMTLLGVCLVVSAAIVSKGYVQSKKVSDQNVATFSGKAKRTVESDQVKWSLVLSSNASTTELAVQNVKDAGETLRKIMTDAGIQDANISFHPMDSTGYPSYDYDYGYSPGRVSRGSATQVVVVETSAVSKMGDVAKQAVSKVLPAVQLRTEHMDYSYRNLDDLEKEMMQEAVRDAGEKASALLGHQRGKMKSLSLPALYVRPEGDQALSSYGYSYIDKTSVKKEVTVTVTVGYYLE